MTTFTNPQCFADYPFEAIDPGAQSALRRAAKRIRYGYDSMALLPRLECYLQTTGQSVSLDKMRSSEWTRICEGFFGALHSHKFEPRKDTRTAYVLSRGFRALLEALEMPDMATPPFPHLLVSGRPSEDILPWINEFEALELDSERVRFWQGWKAINKNGAPFYFRFHFIHKRLGREFAEKLAAACTLRFSSHASRAFPVINEFARYVGDYPHKLEDALH